MTFRQTASCVPPVVWCATELHGRTNFLAYFGKLTADVTFCQPELETTLRRIADAGARGLYGGHTADLLASAAARHAL